MLEHHEHAEQRHEEVCFKAPQRVVAERDDERDAGTERNPGAESLPEHPPERQRGHRQPDAGEHVSRQRNVRGEDRRRERDDSRIQDGRAGVVHLADVERPAVTVQQVPDDPEDDVGVVEVPVDEVDGVRG